MHFQKASKIIPTGLCSKIYEITLSKWIKINYITPVIFCLCTHAGYKTVK